MKFTPTPLPGAFVIDLELRRDERGFFARTWCREELAGQGLSTTLAQCSLSFNPHRGTLRGMHYQAPPHGEVKIVRCTRGAVYDVIVALRPSSPAYARWFGIELDAENRRMLYVPEGVAHGFLTLVPQTEVSYQISRPYVPQAARGVRWDDPAFGIEWPAPVELVSERDRSYPDFTAYA